MTHTPGPWFWMGFILLDTDGRHIATLHLTDEDNYRYNANLIAAAPDLLAALTDAHGTLESIIDEMGNVPDFDDLIATAAKAKQAIAAAEGKEAANDRRKE